MKFKPNTRSLRRRRLQLESLEDRRLLAVDLVNPGAKEGPILNVGPAQPAAPVVSVAVSGASTATRAIANDPSVEAAFDRAANLSRYSSEQLAEVREWVVQLRPGANPASVTQALGGAPGRNPGLIERTYIYTTGQASPQQVIATLQAHAGVQRFYPLVLVDIEPLAIPNDPLFPDQWHLRNIGQSGGNPGDDANVTGVWDFFRGAGVNIAIVDDGLEHTHPDLQPNYNPALSFDYLDGDSDPMPVLAGYAADSHGTAVAGVAAARGFNGIGVSGAAPEATLAGIRFLGAGITSAGVAASVSHMMQDIDIYNNSWGLVPTGILRGGDPLVIAALRQVATEGRGGLGGIEVFAAGNGRTAFDDVNQAAYQNSRHTIAVAAIDQFGVVANYSTPGAAVVVSAPTGNFITDITTTDRQGDAGYNFAGINEPDPDPLLDTDYTSRFRGTSSSAPLVSGVIALMLEANPNLTYRDVVHILAETSAKNNPNDASWVTNGAGYRVSHDFGFGRIDALAAVNAALSWQNVNPERVIATNRVVVDSAVPDNDATGISASVEVFNSGAFRLEYVEVEFTARALFPSDLEVTLTSPSGVVSRLAEARLAFPTPISDPYSRWIFTTVQHWGENPDGEWIINVRDLIAQDVGNFDDFQIRFYGHLEGEQIRGRKFNDVNGNGAFDIAQGEVGLAGFTIYLDQNNNGILDPGEPFDVTASDGSYVLPASIGVHTVREVQQPFYTQTFPTSGFHQVTITERGQEVGDINFGNRSEPAQVTGIKWFDQNGNGVRDPNEPGLPGITIYVDANGNGQRDPGEPFAVTGADGGYRITGLQPGFHRVAEDRPAGYVQTFPANNAPHQFQLFAGQTRGNVNFGNFAALGRIEGTVWNDLDTDGRIDLNEPGLANVRVYVDLDRNGVFTLGEPSAISGSNGSYAITGVVPGLHQVRQVAPLGMVTTFPADLGMHTVTVPPAGTVSGVNFGNGVALDFGDAPIQFPVLASQNGASHVIVPGFHLGARVDRDLDGKPSPDASGDDNPAESFSAEQLQSIGPNTVYFNAFDLDGSGRKDLVTIRRGGSQSLPGAVSVMLNNGDGTFLEPAAYGVGLEPASVGVGDLNGDGFPDLVVANSASASVSVLLNRGDGGFFPAVTFDLPEGWQPLAVAIGDFDGDGLGDLAVAGIAPAPAAPGPAEDLLILFNTTQPAPGESVTPANLTFGESTLETIGEGPVVALEAVDLNGDGRLDLISVNRDDNTISTLLNTGGDNRANPFGNPLDYSVGGRPVAIVVGDFNRDNRLDVAVANQSSNSVSVLLGGSGGMFGPATSFAVMGSPSSLSAGDVTGDGYDDLVVATGQTSSVAVLANRGNGSFFPSTSFTLGSLAGGVVVTDMNSDGVADYVALNGSRDTIAIRVSAGDDEDGVTFGTLEQGRTASVIVNASAPGLLSAWIDFNANNQWEPSERIFADVQLVAGDNQLFFFVPASAAPEMVFSRFRFSLQGGLGPTGPALSGEVEDHLVTIQPASGAGSGYTNPDLPQDVNADGTVNLSDVLPIINELRTNGVRALPSPPSGSFIPPPFVDVNGDGFITLNDVLQVVNYLHRQLAGAGEGESLSLDSASVEPPRWIEADNAAPSPSSAPSQPAAAPQSAVGGLLASRSAAPPASAPVGAWSNADDSSEGSDRSDGADSKGFEAALEDFAADVAEQWFA